MEDKNDIKPVADNRKAYHDYFVLDTIECGIALIGTEVKSIRNSNVQLKDSWCMIENGEMWINNMHIQPYERGNIFNKDPKRVRKLLAHKKEIHKLFGIVQKDGMSLIPLRIYFKNGKVKILVGVCKGKKLYDKRKTIAKKTADREIERALVNKNR